MLVNRVLDFYAKFKQYLNFKYFLVRKYSSDNKYLKFYNIKIHLNALNLIFQILIWLKARVIYYVNNWVYTTNHKRIAVNYFWFVILGGICGTVLATIIRLEMAYPGVGILAGDSLQYLSVVTAHAVIMVFFMLTPLLFGAFGNFLLPTQLGVHDVAFPRLNSAAFWFLPASLLMLCQLVCVDRRYQRMNCFNIREVEALLKGRFFPDLVNSHDHRVLLNSSILGLRYKTNNLHTIDHSLLLFFNYGLLSSNLKRNNEYVVSNLNKFETYKSSNTDIVSNFLLNGIKDFFFHTPNILNIYCLDLNIFFIKLLRGSRVVNATKKRGYLSVLETSHFFYNYIKSELERQLLLYTHIWDFNRPKNLFSTWITNFRFNLLDKFLFGYMENNIGSYFYLTRKWPTPKYIEIQTEGGFVEFFVTGIDHFAQLSIILYGQVIWASFKNFFKLSILALISYFNSMSSYSLIFDSTYVQNSLKSSIISLHLILPLELLKSIYVIIEDVKNTTFLGFGFFAFTDFILKDYEILSSKLFLNTLSVSKFNNMQEIITTTLSLTYDNYKIQSEQETVNTLEHLTENSLFFRYQRLLNPIFRYDYKLGNYFNKQDSIITPYLFTTISEITGGVRKPVWIFSKKFSDVFKENFLNFSTSFGKVNSNKGSLINPYVQNTYGLFNFFKTVSDNSNLINLRWLTLSSFDQKFHKMFLTSSMQQRIFANWRQLKFTREAWRCKLLASRHQKTFYRRYTDEDGIFWAIERNAKDVLPGWAMITPFSARTRFTAVGKVDIGLMGLFLVLNSSVVTSANFLVTYRYLSTLNNRKMRDARSFFSEGVMVASWMMVAANPMLVIAILMLLSDRHWQTSFFDYSGGGDTVLFQHMFWFFGHPEVYIIMIPAFGFNNTILSFYLRKRVSARASLMYSMYTIFFLGFFVWGHHMYMVGLAHTTRMLFSTLTVMISVPAATKLMHWSVTLVNSAFAMELPLFFQLLFIFFFISGGISGMANAHTGMDVLFHDTFYVVGHFHVMFAGSAMYACWGAFYFYFPSIFGVKFSRIYGYLHVFYYLMGQLMTVAPMMWLGYSGMPRRVLDYPASLGGWHSVVSAGHLLSIAGIMAFFIMIFDSLRQSRAVTRNTFGISRFNTRLNFYIYEISRTKYIQRKGWHLARFNNLNILKFNNQSFQNNEFLESSIFSYTFVKRK